EDFAERFGRRGFKPDIPISTCRLKGDTPEHIEQHAMEELTRNGGQAWHLENRFPLGVAGLLFWNVVFAPVKGAFLNPFQNAPVDLRWPDFARVRAGVIRETVTRLGEPGAVYDVLKRTWEEKQGVANALVSWRHFDGRLLDAVLGAIPESSLLDLAHHVLTNLYRARTGFPDLLVIYEFERFEFVEVKGPEDQLQPGQRIWFKSLKSLGLPARVLKFKR
ncbi:MAG: VRR-NUC domain-containing protein, partial [Gammaproteobacteria bacterium]|nr:VRR-NUC domain-containing protein [Gammaproteobacteria bacterium]